MMKFGFSVNEKTLVSREGGPAGQLRDRSGSKVRAIFWRRTEGFFEQREAVTSGKKKRARSNIALVRGHRLRPKRRVRSRVLEKANRQAVVIASAIVATFLAAITLHTLLDG
ncbi:hypothetical protein [Rhizobium phaseoli]|uniref:hypothetical protein n=1 Tax=Rhizobium phaseoli TaxID=396 RepID=UPI0011AEB61A|nr:hypothetical protein [Rhizobium phaseoli]